MLFWPKLFNFQAKTSISLEYEIHFWSFLVIFAVKISFLVIFGHFGLFLVIFGHFRSFWIVSGHFWSFLIWKLDFYKIWSSFLLIFEVKIQLFDVCDAVKISIWFITWTYLDCKYNSAKFTHLWLDFWVDFFWIFVSVMFMPRKHQKSIQKHSISIQFRSKHPFYAYEDQKSKFLGYCFNAKINYGARCHQ